MDEKKPLVSANVKQTYGGSNYSYKALSSYRSVSLCKTQKTLSKDETKSYKFMFFGYLFLVLMNITEVGALILAQLAISKVSIFELNIVRYSIQTVLSAGIVLLKKYPKVVERKHVLIVFGAAVGDLMYGIGAYIAASFLPVGSIQGVLICLYIVLAVFIDLCRGLVQKIGLLSVFVACLGIALLTQPWYFTLPHHENPCAPCDILEGHHPSSSSTCSSFWLSVNNTNNYSTDNFIKWHRNIENVTVFYGYNVNRSGINSNRTVHHSSSWKHSPLVGYALVVTAAIAAAICSNFFQILVGIYKIPTVNLWTAPVNLVLSVIIALIVKGSSGQSWDFPTGKYCLLFCLLFPTFSVANDFLWWITFSFLPVSVVSLGSTPTVVILYISQKTFLKRFHAGYSNFLEPIGAGLAFLGSALMPVLTVCANKKRASKDNE